MIKQQIIIIPFLHTGHCGGFTDKDLFAYGRKHTYWVTFLCNKDLFNAVLLDLSESSQKR
jgi:hypothetical protein